MTQNKKLMLTYLAAALLSIAAQQIQQRILKRLWQDEAINKLVAEVERQINDAA